MVQEKSPAEKLKEEIETIYQQNKRSIKKSEFDIFHFSVRQKLWQSQYYFQRIMDLYDSKYFEENFVIPIAIPDRETEGSTTKYEIEKDKLAKFCNLYLDGYFISINSAFDALAHEVNTIFKLIDSEGDIYINTVLNELKQRLNQSKFYNFLIKEKLKRWWSLMEKYRNTLTHESIIATNIETSTDVTINKEELIKIPLPDNFKKKPFVYNKGYELKSFIEDFDKNILYSFDQSYKRLIQDLKKSGQLPINFGSN